MKIVSKHVDYYDFISKRYGSDPDCTYLRTKVALPRGGRERDEFNKTARGKLGSWNFLTKDAVKAGYTVDVVVAGPHAVGILRRNYTVPHQYDRTLPREDREESVRVLPEHGHLFERATRYEQWKGWEEGGPKWPPLPQGERLHDLIRHVGAPVFRIRENTVIDTYGKRCEDRGVDERVPILKDLGFPALFPPEVIWQDIYTTLTSVLRRDPDKAPPVEVEEKIRIEYAGFDLKTSFRNPINTKPKKKVKKVRR